MKSLFTKSIVLFLVLATSTCAPGRLGTIDRYLPEPTVDDDESYATESDGFTWDYFDDDVDIDATVNYEPHNHTTEPDDYTRGNETTTDASPTGIPLGELVAHIKHTDCEKKLTVC